MWITRARCVLVLDRVAVRLPGLIEKRAAHKQRKIIAFRTASTLKMRASFVVAASIAEYAFTPSIRSFERDRNCVQTLAAVICLIYLLAFCGHTSFIYPLAEFPGVREWRRRSVQFYTANRFSLCSFVNSSFIFTNSKFFKI